MFKSIYNDLKQQINYGNNVTKLVIINVVVFICLYVVFALTPIFAGGPRYTDIQDMIANALSVPAKPMELIKQPWSIFTYMFLHRGIWHLVWNMLILWWFGRIFGDLMGDQRIIPLYILGGLAGMIFFVLGANLLIPLSGYMLGASAGVMAIVIAAAIVAPDYNFNLILIGPVKLKFIALALIVLDLVGIANMDNTGGHFSHIGGMVMGWFFITMVNNGNDPSPFFNKMFDGIKNIFDGSSKNKSRHLKVRHKAKVGRSNSKSAPAQGPSFTRDENQLKLDEILDKISKKGMESLSKEEKEFLDNASKND